MHFPVSNVRHKKVITAYILQKASGVTIMKRFLTSGCIIILFFSMLFLPKEVFKGASSGLLLWFYTILPTLLPFAIFSNLLIYTNSIRYISLIFGPAFKRFFHVSENGSFAILAGFLCGYPMGAKVTADLVHTKQISLSEGQYLLSFCNNTSPMFIISYIVIQNFKQDALIVPTITILLSAPVLCSFLFRRYHRPQLISSLQTQKLTSTFNFHIVDNCIMSAFETITKVGGYVILFSIFITIFQKLPIHFILPFLEITNGISLISTTCANTLSGFLSIFFLAAFGGFCAIAQTSSMIQGTDLSIIPYIIEKLITAMVTSLFALLYVLWIAY